MSTITLDDIFTHADTVAGAAGTFTGVPTTPSVGHANEWLDNFGGGSISSGKLLVTGGSAGGFERSKTFLLRPMEPSSDQGIVIFWQMVGSVNNVIVVFRHSDSSHPFYGIFLASGTVYFQRFSQESDPSNGTILNTGSIGGGEIIGHYYALSIGAVGSAIAGTLYDNGTTPWNLTGDVATVLAAATSVATVAATDTLAPGSGSTTFGVGCWEANPNTATYLRVVGYDGAAPGSGSSGGSGLSIATDDAALSYSNGNWSINGTRARTNAPGADVELIAVTTTLAVKLDMTNTTTNCYVGVRIDEGIWTYYRCASTVNLTPTPLPLAFHYFTIIFWASGANVDSSYIRWDATTGNQFLSITSFVIDADATYQAPPNARFNILVFGNSILEGLLAGPPGYPSEQQYVIGAYGYLLRKKTGARVGVVGYGGQGVETTGAGGVPAFPAAWPYYYGTVPRTFAGIDTVIINEGTNDGIAGVDGAVTDATFTADYAAAINGMLAAPTLPASAKIAVLVPLTGNRAAAIAAAVAVVNSPRVKLINANSPPMMDLAKGYIGGNAPHPYTGGDEQFAGNLALALYEDDMIGTTAANASVFGSSFINGN